MLYTSELLTHKRRGASAASFGVSAGGGTPTGLTFPSNGSGTVQFRFTGAAVPEIQPLTVLVKLNPTQQTGYYTTFFHADCEGSLGELFDSPYVGAHPYPQGGSSGTVHNWEISIQAQDIIVDSNSNSTVVTKGQWYQQALVAVAVSTQLNAKYYWNLSVNANRLIEYTTDMGGGYLNQAAPALKALNFGDAPWSVNAEMLSGIVRGIQVYQSALSLAHINLLWPCETDAAVLAVCTAQSLTPWYLNMNPTPSDISDKSGAGHSPAWVGANRPTLWTG